MAVIDWRIDGSRDWIGWSKEHRGKDLFFPPQDEPRFRTAIRGIVPPVAGTEIGQSCEALKHVTGLKNKIRYRD